VELSQMAQAQGVSKSTVSTIWRSHNLKPHRIKSFKLSRDTRFLEKLTDVVGLYLNPPDQALVLCVDEKTRFRRSIARSRIADEERATGHDDPRLQAQRHDLSVRGAGSTAGQGGWPVLQSPSASGVLEFPAPPTRSSRDVALHLVMDNYGTHKHPNVQNWLKRHPRFVRISCRSSAGSTSLNAGFR